MFDSGARRDITSGDREGGVEAGIEASGPK